MKSRTPTLPVAGSFDSELKTELLQQANSLKL